MVSPTRAAFVAVAIATVGACVFTARATPAMAGATYGVNLVVNGGGEANVGAPDSGHVVKPTGWITTGQFTAVQYGAAGGFPDKTSPGPAIRGKNDFEGGNVALSTAKQTISLASESSAINMGSVRFAFVAWLGGFASQSDNAVATLSFQNANGAALGGATLGPVTPAQRGNITGLLHRLKSGVVPKGASSAVITIVLTRTDGTYNDGAADNVSLVLTKD